MHFLKRLLLNFLALTTVKPFLEALLMVKSSRPDKEGS